MFSGVFLSRGQTGDECEGREGMIGALTRLVMEDETGTGEGMFGSFAGGLALSLSFLSLIL